jgi:serine/threonine protein kinase
VLQLIEDFEYEGHLVIVCEQAASGNLSELLNRQESRAFTTQQAVSLIIGILSGLEHLHSKNIAHLDVTPFNILIDNERSIICDFGLAMDVSVGRRIALARAGTPPYAAPEGLCGEYSFQSDIWSVGVLFYQMLLGYKFSHARDYEEFLTATLKTPTWLSRVPAHLKEVVRLLCRKSLAKDISL